MVHRCGVALAIACVLATSPVAAQSPQACGKRADILKHLGHQYREAPIALGLADNGSLVEIIASEGGGTWTLIFSMPNGVSCLVATGHDWQIVLSQPQGEGI